MLETANIHSLASLRRIHVVTRYTLGEVLHLRLLYLLLLVDGGLLFVAWQVREFNFGAAAAKFLSDFGLGAIGLSGMLLAALLTGQLFFNSIADGTVCFQLTRAVRRWEFVWGRFLGIAAALALFSAVSALLLGCLLTGQRGWSGGLIGTVPVFCYAVAVLWLKMTLVAAMTLLVCSYASSALFASGAGLLLAMLGHLRPLAEEMVGAHWFRVWPNFALFDVEVIMTVGQLPSGVTMLAMLVYWSGYVVILGQLAVFVFKRREF